MYSVAYVCIADSASVAVEGVHDGLEFGRREREAHTKQAASNLLAAAANKRHIATLAHRSLMNRAALAS